MSKSKGRRDLNTIANRRLPTLSKNNVRLRPSPLSPRMNQGTFRRFKTMRPSVPLQAAEDRRYWHPAAPIHRPVRTLSGVQSHRLVIGKPNGRKQVSTNPYKRSAVAKPDMAGPPHQIAFHAPEKVVICVRRKRRKEVIFALNKAGKGGQRRPRRTHNSGVQC